MPKGYWITAYRKVSDSEKLKHYAELAGPAIAKAGGKFLARGLPAHIYEAGLNARTVLIEFESVAAAKAAFESADYKKALDALGNAAERDIRIVEGAG